MNYRILRQFSELARVQIKTYPKKTDLESCEQEPIHLIPRVQQHGFLVVLDAHLNILQVSDNLQKFMPLEPDAVLGKHFEFISSDRTLQSLKKWQELKVAHLPFSYYYKDLEMVGIPHQVGDLILIDVEPTTQDYSVHGFQQEMLDILQKLNATANVPEMVDKAATLLKELLDYDRVMIYEFDPNWNGSVIAEAKEKDLQSWLGLHYPAGDIPANARNLFLQQGVRILSDVSTPYSNLLPSVNPLLNALVPTANSHLRGSSPIHIEYLNNMGVNATLTCAIVKEEKLWGLIACHHHSPKYLSFQKRKSCQLLAQMFSNQLVLKKSNWLLAKVNESTGIRSKLINQISENWDLVAGLCDYESTGKDLIPCDGFAVLYNNEYKTVGKCPPRSIADQLSQEIESSLQTTNYYESTCLVDDFKWIQPHVNDFSGLLYHKITPASNEALMWFKQEQVSTVTWAGKDDKQESKHELSPRKSFDKWTQKVHCTSTEWKDYEKAGVVAFVDDVKSIIITRYGEVNRLNKQLESLNKEIESFSYSVSHDLRGPLRGIDGFAQILLEDYQDQLDDYAKDSLKIIIDSADRMNSLMDDILSYSGLSSKELQSGYVDTVAICNTILQEHRMAHEFPQTKIIVSQSMPKIYGDRTMVLQLFSNLITNAVKYSSQVNNPQVEVGCNEVDGQNVYFVKDNGIGFDLKYKEKIFNVFTRLHTTEFEGSGVGLALVQRIIHKHEGKIWVKAAPNQGATFYFYLPNESNNTRK